jgi:nitrite reductase/ring-hydroxylating ferredoxin subunit
VPESDLSRRVLLTLPGADRLRVGAAIRFAFDRGGREEEGFLVRHASGFAAYRNRCRHADSPLDMGDGEFFDDEGRSLRCRLHGALYRPDDGACVEGPCAGSALESFEVVREDRTLGVLLAPGDRPPS